jgi:BRCT domain type II-containing protein
MNRKNAKGQKTWNTEKNIFYGYNSYGPTKLEKLNHKIISLSNKNLKEIISSTGEGEYDIIEKQMAQEELDRRSSSRTVKKNTKRSRRIDRKYKTKDKDFR